MKFGKLGKKDSMYLGFTFLIDMLFSLFWNLHMNREFSTFVVVIVVGWFVVMAIYSNYLFLSYFEIYTVNVRQLYDLISEFHIF